MDKTKIILDKRSTCIYVRRSFWDKDSGKMKYETLHKIDRDKMYPPINVKLPKSINVTDSEKKQYQKLIEEINENHKISSIKTTLSAANNSLKRIERALSYKEYALKLSPKELEEIANLAGSVKKAANSYKNAIKKKENRKK